MVEVLGLYMFTKGSKPWWWALIGVSSTSSINNDLIFREEVKQ